MGLDLNLFQLSGINSKFWGAGVDGLETTVSLGGIKPGQELRLPCVIPSFWGGMVKNTNLPEVFF